MLSSVTLFQHVKKNKKLHPAEHDNGSNRRLSPGHHPKVSSATIWEYLLSHVVRKRHYPSSSRIEIGDTTSDHQSSPCWLEDSLQDKVSPPPYEYPLASSPPPPYICTVYKYGHVCFKQEFDRQRHVFPKRQFWKHVYAKLWGTALKIYASPQSNEVLFSFSLQHMEVGMAPETNARRPFVIRFRSPLEGQFLFQVESLQELISWIEHSQAASNISVDLSHRRMPRFVTMIRPNSRSDTTTVTLFVNMNCRATVSLCPR